VSDNFNFLKKNILWQRAAYFLCIRSSLLESEIATKFQVREACSSLDLTEAKYGISRPSVAEKENVGV
jgi:hypothetical protein